MKIETSLISELTIFRFGRMRDILDMDPAYQREGGIWREAMQERLIDSVINGLDIPKLYFEVVRTKTYGPSGRRVEYAVIDGKQRLQAILAFLDGDLRLPEDFAFFEDESVNAKGMTLSGLMEHYSWLAERFLYFELPVVRVDTDSGDLVEEMFQRLNASATLTAAEKRNSISGPTKTAVNALADHTLLTECSPIKNARYKYRELAAKFLAVEQQLDTKGRIVDTKADTLLQLFKASKGNPPLLSQESIDRYAASASQVLDRMTEVFEEGDRLLRSIGTVVVFYVVFREMRSDPPSRQSLLEFEDARRSAAKMSEEDPDYPRTVRLREYNLLVQSTNDGTAITRRAEIVQSWVSEDDPEERLVALEGLSESEAVGDSTEDDS